MFRWLRQVFSCITKIIWGDEEQEQMSEIPEFIVSQELAERFVRSLAIPLDESDSFLPDLAELGIALERGEHGRDQLEDIQSAADGSVFDRNQTNDSPEQNTADIKFVREQLGRFCLAWLAVAASELRASDRREGVLVSSEGNFSNQVLEGIKNGEQAIARTTDREELLSLLCREFVQWLGRQPKRALDFPWARMELLSDNSVAIHIKPWPRGPWAGRAITTRSILRR